MTTIVHIVGPQGAGKTTLAALIAAALKADRRNTGQVCADESPSLSNNQIRARWPGDSWVLVESEELGPRHSDLAPGDWLVTVARGGATSVPTLRGPR
jgi:energy-coupling factor transporter ATP-binding protein EcfA2